MKNVLTKQRKRIQSHRYTHTCTYSHTYMHIHPHTYIESAWHTPPFNSAGSPTSVAHFAPHRIQIEFIIETFNQLEMIYNFSSIARLK